MFELNSFSDVRVLVIGDVMLDQYWHGSTHRISPEAPVPVLKVAKQEYRAGGAANVALNCATLGANTTLVSVVGNDLAAEKLMSLLEKQAVRCDFIVDKTVPTTTKLRMISANQQLLRCDQESMPENPSSHVIKKLQAHLRYIDIVILSDYAKGVLQNAQELIALCRSKNIPVIVDPKSKDFSKYQGATLLTPNLHEFEAAMQQVCDEKSIDALMRSCIKTHQLDALLVTRGPQGMTLLDNQAGELIHHQTQAKEVFDITGAGDTVIAVLSVMRAKGSTLEQSAYHANVAAGIAVSKLGTAQISVAELNEKLASVKQQSQSFVELSQLSSLLKSRRQQGQKIVFTNGCFDILHAGHVQYLNDAKALGDCLVVGLNDDDSIRRLKGQNRPIHCLAHRAQILSALSMVDFVVPFSEDTPLRLIQSIVPDVLAKGEDYKVDEIVGGDIVRQSGGNVVTLPFVQGLSSSNAINRLTAEEYV